MTRFDFVRRWLNAPESGFRSLVAIGGTVGIASILRWLCGAAADPVPFVTYYPAIVLCTLIAGWRAGVVSFLASASVVNVIFFHDDFWLSNGARGVATLVLFFVSCAALIAIAQTLRSNFIRLQVANARTDYLNQELMHRMRNTLAIINAIAAQTFKSEPTNFIKAFSARMTALADGLDVLAADKLDECDLNELLEAACRPFKLGDNISISGPSHTLPGSICIPVTLAIHELCTNSVKYGALSADTGRVHIQIQGVEATGHVLVGWRETGGPEVCEPTRKGLGSALLRHPALGPADIHYLREGLHCRIWLKAN